MEHDRPVILILGPTAGGKTRLSLELAQRLEPGGGECICADSMQVYRGMNIGTAKPTAQEQAIAPHHLIDLVDPADESFTVDRWLDLAERAIAGIRARGRWPIVVGGTNLYIKALLEGLFEGPQPDAGLRASLEDQSTESLRARLEKIDPAAAARIHPNDRRRTIRAIEVHELTGRPISAHQEQWDRGRMREDCFIVGLDYPVETINRRINARVRQMMADGFAEEVRALAARGPVGRQAREALGYEQILRVLDGTMPLEEAVEEIKIRTRRFAKQQRTWLKRFRAYPRSLWISVKGDVGEAETAAILEWIVSQADRSPARRSEASGP